MTGQQFSSVHDRWHAALPAPGPDVEVDGYIEYQCGGCRLYVPLEGGLGSDWGACANPESPHDRTVVFEHYGCAEHSDRDHPA